MKIYTEILAKYNEDISDRSKNALRLIDDAVIDNNSLAASRAVRDYLIDLLRDELLAPNTQYKLEHISFHLNEHGRLHGEFRSYQDNSQPYIICQFDDGKLVGLFRAFHPNGRVWENSHYVDGKPNGRHCTYYDYDGGKVCTDLLYDHGKLITKAPSTIFS